MKTWLAIGLGTLGAWVALMGMSLYNFNGWKFSGFDLLVGQPPEYLYTGGYKIAVWVATISLLGVSAYSMRKATQAERN